MKHSRKGATITKAVLSLIFILFAVVQLNDPDPIIWFSIYLFTAVLCLLSIFRKLPQALLYGYGLVLIFYAAVHLEFAIQWILSENKSELFGEMQKDKNYLEGTREFMGLLIVILTVVYLIVQNRKPKTK